MAISPQEATEKASKFYKDTTNDFAEIKLEEIEKVANYWYVTLAISTGVYQNYKVFKVDAGTGEVLSMKMLK